MTSRVLVALVTIVTWAAAATLLNAQEVGSPAHAHDAVQAAADEHQRHDSTSPDGWEGMYDGAVFVTYNQQGGPRGETQVTSQNWLMGMTTRRLGAGVLTLSGMLSIEPLTVTGRGYSELFQTGETYQHRPLADHQHPHDLVMQATAAWRVPIGSDALTIGGGPVGEATVGPTAFMHRPSAADNPTAPLGHHTMDSTHVTTGGVIMAGVDHGPLTFEGSVFRGREPDENRWDVMDPGPLDSWAARVWFRPGAWAFQVSHAYLHQPDPLEFQDVKRTTASASWFRTGSDGYTAMTFAVGKNQRAYSDSYAWLFEAAHHKGRTGLYSRFERVDLETEHLLFPGVVHIPHPGELIDPLPTLTLGIVRDTPAPRGVELSVGGDVTFYDVPSLLRAPYSDHPVSFHVYLRVRPTRDHRMWRGASGHP